MKTTQGFVAATTDGQFLYCGRTQTMVGDRPYVEVVADIEQASVFSAPRFGYRDMHKVAVAHTRLPVEIRREVILKGYGT